MTRERIRQLQNIALHKLRKALGKKERPQVEAFDLISLLLVGGGRASGPFLFAPISRSAGRTL